MRKLNLTIIIKIINPIRISTENKNNSIFTIVVL